MSKARVFCTPNVIAAKAGGYCKCSNKCAGPKTAPVPRANFRILLLQCCVVASRMRHRNGMRPGGCRAGSTESTVTAKIHETRLLNHNHRLGGNWARRFGQRAIVRTEDEEAERNDSEASADEVESKIARPSDAGQHPHRRLDSKTARLSHDWRGDCGRRANFIRQTRTRN